MGNTGLVDGDIDLTRTLIKFGSRLFGQMCVIMQCNVCSMSHGSVTDVISCFTSSTTRTHKRIALAGVSYR